MTYFTTPTPRKSLSQIEPYKPGLSKIANFTGTLHKLSSNESPLGCSPKALEAFRACDNLELYPDGTALALRQTIAKKYHIGVENIVCGAGSDELLNLLCQAYLEPGDEGIYTEHGFLIYKIAMLAAGATPVVVKEKNLTTDVDAILAAVTSKTKIIFIANPNNPTGTYIPFTELKRLQDAIPKHIILVIDAAYAEYVNRNDYSPGIELVTGAQNVVMTRTFSKIHGLAALRLGWLYAPEEICVTLNKIRGPFNINTPALQAGIAAIEDDEHIAKSMSHNTQWRDWLTSALQALGLSVVPSAGNFVLIDFGQKSAKDAEAFLNAHGCILRNVASYGLNNHLRLSVGSQEANETVVATLKAWLFSLEKHERH